MVPHRLTDDTVSHLPEISILQAHPRAKGTAMLPSRALSSADEGGPALKKLRSTMRGVEKASKSVAAADDAHSKKARARPALTLVNLFSSAGRRPQPTATSSRHAPAAGSRSDRDGSAPGGGTRRSARLMGTGGRPPMPSKVGDLIGWTSLVVHTACFIVSATTGCARPTTASHAHTITNDGF